MTFDNPLTRLFIGIILIALLDTIGSIASNKLNFKYIQLVPLSLAIYIFVGIILAKVTNYSTTIIYTGLLGLLDATIGLKLSLYFKANMGLDENQIKKMQGTQTRLTMIVVGVIFGSIGYSLA